MSTENSTTTTEESVRHLPPPGEMGLMEHLHELRRRLVYCFIGVAVGSVVAYAFSHEVFELLSAPYHRAFPNQALIGTGPAEAFLIRIKVALFSGALLVSPFLFAQLWLFVAPGLYESERKFVIPFVAASCALFLLGIWLCYTTMLPLAFTFFSEQYQEIGLTPTVKISEHLSLVVTSLLGFGIVFEMPIVAFILGRAGIIDHKMLIGGARYATVAIFVISAILTPPDIMSQFLMATPLLALYGLSILILKYTARNRAKKE